MAEYHEFPVLGRKPVECLGDAEIDLVGVGGVDLPEPGVWVATSPAELVE